MFASLILITLYSCESDKAKIEDAKEVVNRFVTNLQFDNSTILYKTYPNFKKIKRYWVLKDFIITSATIDEDQVISIVGTSSHLGNILFIVKKIDGNYIIEDSKGISSVFNSPIYKYCRALGCFGFNIYDKDISQICSQKEEEFGFLVQKTKRNIEENVVVQSSNVTYKFGGYLSGELTLKNNSHYNIPGGDYEIYYHFLNSSGDVVFTKKEQSNFKSIPAGESLSLYLIETGSNSYDDFRTEIKLTSTDFIESTIAENIKGANCQIISYQ